MPCADSLAQDREDDKHMREGAELLCEALRFHERLGLEIPPPYASWWERHKARDQKAALEVKP